MHIPFYSTYTVKREKGSTNTNSLILLRKPINLITFNIL
jgi:hypothetical protein